MVNESKKKKKEQNIKEVATIWNKQTHSCFASQPDSGCHLKQKDTTAITLPSIYKMYKSKW